MENSTASLSSTTEMSCTLCWIGAVLCIMSGVATILIYFWIVVCIAVTERLHTASNYFLASLCVCEICIGICFIWIGDVFQVFFQKHSVLNLASILSCCLSLLSSYLMNAALIAADRYLKIARPLQYLSLMSNRRCVQLIVAVWIIWLIPGLSLFIFMLTCFEVDELYIEELISNNQFSIFISVVLDVTEFPLVICIACFIAGIVRIAKTQKRRIQTEVQMLGHIRRSDAQQEDGVDRQVSEPVQLQDKGSNKTTVYIVVHFVAYVTAWIPVVLTVNIGVFSSSPLEHIFVALFASLSLGLVELTFGTLFVVYVQIEHRQSSRTTWQKVLAFFRK